LRDVTHRPLIINLTALTILSIRRNIGQLDEILKKPLVVLAFVTDTPKLLGVGILHDLLGRTLALRGGINQNTILVGEKLFIAIRGVFASVEPLSLHAYLQII
jgi:hypothetical protein